MLTPAQRFVRPPPPAPRGQPLELALNCNACGRVSTHEIAQVVMHPELERCRAEGWDGIFLGRVILCTHCGAEDNYELTGQARLTLTAETLKLAAGETDPGVNPPLIFGVAALWDGSVVHRPSQGLAKLRDAAAREPGRAEPWRRLGNLALRYGSRDEAESAFRKAVEVDEHEAEAAHSLAEMFWDAGRFADAAPFLAMTLERLSACDSPPDLGVAMARSTLTMVREVVDANRQPLAVMAIWSRGTSGRDPVVSVSSVDLRGLSDAEWQRLGEFLVDGRLIRARLTSEVPEAGEPTQLAALLARRDVVSAIPPYVPTPPGRNRPCPCGSGKKRKLCCGP